MMPRPGSAEGKSTSRKSSSRWRTNGRPPLIREDPAQRPREGIENLRTAVAAERQPDREIEQPAPPDAARAPPGRVEGHDLESVCNARPGKPRTPARGLNHRNGATDRRAAERKRGQGNP